MYIQNFISESENHVLYKFITQSEIFQTFILWDIDNYASEVIQSYNFQ